MYTSRVDKCVIYEYFDAFVYTIIVGIYCNTLALWIDYFKYNEFKLTLLNTHTKSYMYLNSNIYV